MNLYVKQPILSYTQSMTSSKHYIGSKWTSQQPQNKEKHFVIVDITHQTTKTPQCLLEAILTKHRMQLPLSELENPQKWLPGWK